jgi:mannose-6-phosphate isomerase
MLTPQIQTEHKLICLPEFSYSSHSIPADSLTPAEALALRLDAQYPGGDVGVLSAFLLNIVSVPAGGALFMAAGEPHAYVSGNCVEVMARSDNVVRGGCTVKLKDVPTLVSMLTYSTCAADEVIVAPVQSQAGSV